MGPACLPKQPVQADTDCYASGWGGIQQDIFMNKSTPETPNNEMSSWLRAAKLKVLSSEACVELYHSYYAKSPSQNTQSCIKSKEAGIFCQLNTRGKQWCFEGDLEGELIIC